MRTARLRLLALTAVAAAMPALSHDAAPAGEDEITAPVAPAPQRMTVAVAVGETDPRPFIVDTGAERSVISRQLAATLRLPPGPSVRLVSMTGVQMVDTVLIPSLTIGQFRDTRAFHAPALDAVHLGADGLLGIEQLRNRVLVIDFERNQMLLRGSRAKLDIVERGPVRAPDEIVVQARSAFGQLIVTDAHYESTRITVVIDTGSAVSMGNSALAKRLGRTQDAGMVTLTSVTGGQLTTPYRIARRVRLGSIQIEGLPVAFSDVPPFRRFGLTGRPAMLLGMDSLRLFRRVEVDFGRREVRFDPYNRLPRARP